ncbi:MAG: Coenzyme F420 hydrogenase/dehydrogenase, beta subunit C-terminal domain [Caulobacterales bacterium]|nr:Coenzyme F420 hydrogenase/dehydrogenase, beta subunit C-terminal domain [Caulobacterales bacterium]
MGAPDLLLDRIVEGGLCSGCGLCAGATSSGAVEMVYAGPGYLRPAQRKPLSEADAAMVRAACPGLTIARPAAPPGAREDVTWGSYLTCHTGWSTDPQLRRQGSSGGGLSAVARHLLASGEVEFVAQVTAHEAAPTRNRLILSTTAESVLAAAGSRYAPTAPLASLNALLAQGRRFAFVGKPCDVAALRAYARRDERVDALIPYMLAFFCGGVPSEEGTQEILRQMGLEGAELASFRYRGDGWPGMARAVAKDGRTAAISYDETWGDILSHTLQFRCKICADSIGQAADVVFADAWHVAEDGKPSFAEREGRSLVMGRTEKGARLVEAAVAGGALEVAPLDIAELDRMQPYQKHRRSAVGWRIAALRLFARPATRYPGHGLPRAMLRGNPLRNWKNFLGTIRRLLFRGEAREAAAKPGSGGRAPDRWVSD